MVVLPGCSICHEVCEIAVVEPEAVPKDATVLNSMRLLLVFFVDFNIIVQI